ncbi:MAG: ATPase [Vallitaleaceae bacterium]|nr:ATPase [Vallitaleaceae bacterium]
MSREIVIGIDGGGSHTRAIAVDLSGKTMAYIEEKGANPYHNTKAQSNIKNAIHQVLAEADRTTDDVVHLVAGLAGIDKKEDILWAQKYVELPGLEGKCTVESDALIAQVGAFKGAPGIVAISGTGSVIYGVNEQGIALCNYDYMHYSSSAARYLSFELIHLILAGQFVEVDQGLVEKVLNYWGLVEIEELRMLGSRHFDLNEEQCNKKFGDMAPIITEAAGKGSPLACLVCDHAVYGLVLGIYLAGASFKAMNIPVSLIGGVLTSPYMRSAVGRALADNLDDKKNYFLQEPLMSPIMGAVQLAFEKIVQCSYNGTPAKK